MNTHVIKCSLGIAAFLMLIAIAGKTDADTYKGIHSIKGIVCDSGEVRTDNGKLYKVEGFSTGSEVTIKLDGQGNILSIITK